MKFKVGDKVEFLGVDRDVGAEFAKGSLWVIRNIDARNYYLKGWCGYWDKEIFERGFKLAEVGTLKELNVKPGDVVRCEQWLGKYYTAGKEYPVVAGFGYRGKSIGTKNTTGIWSIVSRASDNPKLWKDMTPEEKGALLLAHHEGKEIECHDGTSWFVTSNPKWVYCHAYRIRPEPKVETVTLSGNDIRFSGFFKGHRITFTLVDGKPDCDSVKMEKL